MQTGMKIVLNLFVRENDHSLIRYNVSTKKTFQTKRFSNRTFLHKYEKKKSKNQT